MRARRHRLTEGSVKGDKAYLLYWMQSTQRVEYNYGLSDAIALANRYQLPLKVLFIVTPHYPDANLRHYQFMLEGLSELKRAITSLNATFCVEIGDFEATLARYWVDAAYMVMDFGYLAHHKQLRQVVKEHAERLSLGVVSVESDVIVPVEVAESKCAYSARTIRPKLLKKVDDYLEKPPLKKLSEPALKGPDFDIDTLINQLDVDRCVTHSRYFTGGRKAALKRLSDFIENALEHYLDSQDPSTQLTSYLSPYLHFGMIGPQEVYLEVAAYLDTYPAACEAFLEQLLVRRELAFNFVYFCEGYDRFETMTYPWAYETMAAHRDDRREFIYSLNELAESKTHDVYFNAAMTEMVKTGFMHNYMRMYWGKKIIEWSVDYKTAYETIITLNNRYFLDGRDPNSYASVAWLFGRHDRAWTEREIFGKLRYMNANGLKRKFAIDTYLDYVNKL